MTPTWNLMIVIFFIAIAAFGFVMQREKLTAALIASYIALAVTIVWGDAIYQILSGNQVIFGQIWLRGNVNPFTVKTVIFVVLIVLLSFKSKVVAGRSSRIASPFITLIYSVLCAGLIVSSIISFMKPADQTSIINSSNLAAFIMKFKTWWVLLPALMMIFVSATSQRDEVPANGVAKGMNKKEVKKRRFYR